MNDMVLVGQYSEQSEAYIAAGMLRANGIEADVQSDAMSLVFPAPGAGGGSVMLYVPASESRRAIELLKSHDDAE